MALLPPSWPDPPLPVPDPEGLDLRAPRVALPDSLPIVHSGRSVDRAGHSYGKAYRDVVRALHGQFANPPDLVVYPADERELADLLDWCAGTAVAAIPYGGGSSVVGGVEYRGELPWVSVDLGRLDRVLDVDTTSRAALIQAGAFGPAIERALAGHGLTLRHFPQSFEFSTLGGWLATRAGGHFATLHTHIDDFVEALRVVTPSGVVQTRRLPASGAGPSPDRMFLGSEGTLGVITRAWLRVRERPRFKESAGVAFADMHQGLAAVRAIAQSGTNPANCRLLDPMEAAVNAGARDGCALLVLGTESADHPTDADLARIVEIATDHGGTARPSTQECSTAAVDTWRGAFVRMPYLRDALVRVGVIVETFETACTWDVAGRLYEQVRAEVGKAIQEVCGEPGVITCRLTHVYPDGPAPYFTVIANARRGSEVVMWDEIKAAAGDALDRLGATVTHHHAVGRDHRRWYDRQRPDLYANVLDAAKKSLDPTGILNPGVLIDRH